MATKNETPAEKAQREKNEAIIAKKKAADKEAEEKRLAAEKKQKAAEVEAAKAAKAAKATAEKAEKAKLKEAEKAAKDAKKVTEKAAKEKEREAEKAAKAARRAEGPPWENLEAGAKQQPPRDPSVGYTTLELIKSQKNGATLAEIQTAIGEKHVARRLLKWLNVERGYGFIMDPKTKKIVALAPNLQVPVPKAA